MLAFADVVVLVVVARRIDEVQCLKDDSIEIVADWLNENGLKLAAEEKEAVIISRTKKRIHPTLTVEEKKIQTVDSIIITVLPWMRGYRSKNIFWTPV